MVLASEWRLEGLATGAFRPPEEMTMMAGTGIAGCMLRRAAVLLAAVVAACGGLAMATAGQAVASAPAAPVSSLCPDATVAAFRPNFCVFHDTVTPGALPTD